MRTRWSLNDLPENLVPFQARWVETQLIWSSACMLNETDLLKACSFSIDSQAPGVESKTFFAERYGGSGIVQNGGGARCGFDGQYQVKGMGANPLVGVGTDRHHSNGALAEDYAIYESIWGEILAALLPYGAVRSLAVLRTDQYINIEFERNSRCARKALLVREPVIRPAHFERAPYFNPQPYIIDQIHHDYDRVGIAIGKLPYMLPEPCESYAGPGYHGTEKQCVDGMVELAIRQARQMAFCRTRLIMLTTSPSNIALDGRLLDFNGVFCLSPSDDIYDFEFKLKFNNLIGEPGVLLQGLQDLCLNLGKHLFTRAFSEALTRRVTQVFNHELNICCAMQQLKLTGIEVAFIKSEEGLSVLYRMAMLLARLISLFHARYGHFSGESMRQTLSIIVSDILCPVRRTASDLRDLMGLDQKLYAQVNQCRASLRDLINSGEVAINSIFELREQVEAHMDRKYGDRIELKKGHMLQEINKILSSPKSSTEVRVLLQQLTARKMASARDLF